MEMGETQTGGPDRRKVDNGKHVRRRQVTFGLSYLLTSLLALWLFQEFVLSPLFIQTHEIPSSEFRAKVKAGQVVGITIGSPRIVGEMKNLAPTSDRDKVLPFDTVAPPNGDPKLLDELDAAGVTYRVKPPASPLGDFLLSWLLPLGLLGMFGTRRTAEQERPAAGSSAWARARRQR